MPDVSRSVAPFVKASGMSGNDAGMAKSGEECSLRLEQGPHTHACEA